MEKELASLREALVALSWKDRLSIINLWFLLSSVGNISALVYSSRVAFERYDIATQQVMTTALGLACFMLWFCVAQYLEFFPKYYIIISMLKKTAPRVSQFLLGVFPIFIGKSNLKLNLKLKLNSYYPPPSHLKKKELF